MEVTREGNYHVPASFDPRSGCWGIQVTFGGRTYPAFIYVSDAKADKHVIGGHWPAQQGNVHTGLTIDEDQFEPLFRMVGADLALECLRRGGGARWFELKYQADELPGQYFSGNVATQNFRRVRTVLVGGSTGYHPTHGCFVYINHGPY